CPANAFDPLSDAARQHIGNISFTQLQERAVKYIHLVNATAFVPSLRIGLNGVGNPTTVTVAHHKPLVRHHIYTSYDRPLTDTVFGGDLCDTSYVTMVHRLRPDIASYTHVKEESEREIFNREV